MILPAILADALAACGVLQGAAGLVAVRRFAGRLAAPAAPAAPPISVLKPLHGDEPLLEAALASFCTQDYPEYQIVFGLADAADPALAVARRLARRFPERDIAIVVDPRLHGANRKVGNLINMLPAARHDMLVFSDSDVHAPPDCLARLAATLERPRTGLATALYAGLPAHPGLVGRLAATQINHTFLPGVLLARALGRQDCLGAAMAIRRETLERIGGLAALADHIADDAMLGYLVRARGLAVRVAGTLIRTTIPEATLLPLLRHELRWARTTRALAPLGFAAASIQYPLFWAGLGLSAGTAWSAAAFFAVWGSRAVFAHGIDRALGLAPTTAGWQAPLRDVISVTLMAASYLGDEVTWRDQVMQVDRPARAPDGASELLSASAEQEGYAPR